MPTDKNELARVASIIAKLKGIADSRSMGEAERKALEKPSFWVSDVKVSRKKDRRGNRLTVYEIPRLVLSLGSIVKVRGFYLALSDIDEDGYAVEVYDSNAKKIGSFRARKDVKECKLADNLDICIEIKKESDLGFEGKLEIIMGYVGSGPGQ